MRLAASAHSYSPGHVDIVEYSRKRGPSSKLSASAPLRSISSASSRALNTFPK